VQRRWRLRDTLYKKSKKTPDSERVGSFFYIFAAMKSVRFILFSLLFALPLTVSAQRVKPEDRAVSADEPVMEPMVKVGKTIADGDSIPYVELNNVYIYPTTHFTSARERKVYNRLVINVKKVLPIAKECNKIIIETYQYLETLPTQKAREEHMKRVEEAIKKEYTPRMKKLTYAQGKLLIKLVHRECNSSSYQLIQAFLGPVKAGFYQAFAWVFGASLKKEYEPETTDRLTERVVRMVESGQI